jgi:RHH-type proline utilization regulon transcriptional repressor/proline dehydrogenase/delta 1-pyrroline-5-carboxylate dehydrogenase
MTLADEYGAGPEEIEMQLLYGMGEPLLLAALQLGYQGRIYTPVGDLEKGLAYLVRRLLENSSKTSMLVNLSEFLAGRMTKKQLLAPPLA